MTVLRREVHVPIYWLFVGLAVMVVSPLLSIWVSAKINEHTIRQGERARAEAKVESTARYCRLLGAQVDVYKEATSPVGIDAYQTWLTEYRTQGCQPGK